MYIGIRSPVRKCPTCGKNFWAKGNPLKRNFYCSKKCSGAARKSGEIVTCMYCGKKVYKEKCRIDKAANLFCTLLCANKYQGRNKVKFNCKTCGKSFRLSLSVVEQRTPLYCSILCRNNDEEWIKKASINSNIAQYKKKGLNKLEKTGNDILKELNIEFYNQFSIEDKFLVDVFIPKKNIVIQWDGDYWHGHKSKLRCGKPDYRQKKRMDLDKSQDAYMKKCGYLVLRFWEYEVYNNKEKVKESIKENFSRRPV